MSAFVRTIAAVALLLPSISWAAQIGDKKTEPIQLPYSQTFDEPSSMDDFTILDENNDGKYWTWNNKEAGCPQNANLQADDWLILRPVMLQANTDYFLKFKARRERSSDKERFEVYMGTDAIADEMTIELIPPTEPNDAYGQYYEKTIRVSAPGLYYIGFHAISDKWKSRMIVDDITLKGGANDAAPVKPSQFTVTPDPEGELQATISFVTPNMSVTGEAVQTLTKASIFRDEQEIYTVDNPPINSLIEWTDRDVTAGYHTYEVAAYNGAGIGDKASTNVYVGLYHPGYPQNVTLAETANYGEVKLSWEAPTTDRHGNALNPLKIRYRIAKNAGNSSVTVAEGIAGTTYTFRAVAADDVQEFIDYRVYASTNGGENNIPGVSNTIPVGTPFALPYAESFNTDSGSSATPLASQTVNGAVFWYWYDDGEYSLGTIRSQDGDNGYISMYAPNLNYAGRLMTAKIDLSGTSNPAISFYAYKMAEEDANEISIEVSQQGNPFGSISTVKLTDYPGTGWVKITYPVTRYRNRVVQFAIKATVITDAYTPLDNLRVYDMPATDAAVCRLSMPASVRPNEPFTATVDLENNGASNLEGITVELLRNGDVEAVSAPIDILSGATASIDFPLSLSAIEGAEHIFQARVVCEGDDLPLNNISEELTLSLLAFDYPKVENLWGETVDGTVELVWTAPDGTLYKHPQITDDFESYPSFANTNVGPWTFVDNDKGNIGGIGSGDNFLDFPGIEGPQSWWVMDAGYSEIPNYGYVEFWQAHSGSKYLMQEYSVNDSHTAYVNSDDWIISPELSGDEQTISFWYKAYNVRYRETFDFLVSTTGNALEDFGYADGRDGFSDKWTLFTYDVPQETKYFAIRCISKGTTGMAMFIDDISYTPGGDAIIPHLSGFNVYRDGTKITDTPVSVDARAGDTCRFLDYDAPVGDHRYMVTVVWDKGESAPSNEVTAMQSGVEDVTVQSADTAPRYYNLQGMEIRNAAPGTVCIEVLGGTVRKIIR